MLKRFWIDVPSTPDDIDHSKCQLSEEFLSGDFEIGNRLTIIQALV
jgi:hypothetical protein